MGGEMCINYETSKPLVTPGLVFPGKEYLSSENPAAKGSTLFQDGNPVFTVPLANRPNYYPQLTDEKLRERQI